LRKGGEILSDKDYHEGYFEGVRATLTAFIHFQNDINMFHAWLNKEVKESKEVVDEYE